MNKIDFGALLAGAVAIATSLAVMARDYLGYAFRQIGLSFKTLVASPAVWVAVICAVVGGFVVGHIEGASGKSTLRNQVVELRSKSGAHEKRAAEAFGIASDLTAEVARLKSEIEGLKANPPSQPSGERVATVPRRSAPKAPPAKAAAPAASWNPFK